MGRTVNLLTELAVGGAVEMALGRLVVRVVKLKTGRFAVAPGRVPPGRPTLGHTF